MTQKINDGSNDACVREGHNFQVKRANTVNAIKNGNGCAYNDISELYCQRCGLVCFLQGRESESNIVRPRSN